MRAFYIHDHTLILTTLQGGRSRSPLFKLEETRDLLRLTEADLGFHTQTEPNVQPHREALGFITRNLFTNTRLFNDYKDNDGNSAFSIMPSAQPRISDLVMTAISVT